MDCGEGTQRQMIRAGVSYMKVKWIALSHFHGDHVLGVPGLLQSMALSNRKSVLTFFGPAGLADLLTYMQKGGLIPTSFPVHAVEMESGSSARIGGHTLRAVNATHKTRALSFRVDGDERAGRFYPKRALRLGVPPGPMFGKLQRYQEVVVGGRTVHPSEVMGPRRAGPSVGYAVDTRPNRAIQGLMKGVGVLIFDATFSGDMLRRAKLTGHSTAAEAAECARKAGAGRLYLDHISGRYEDTSVLLSEARDIFPKSYMARDFLRHRVKPLG